MKRLERTLVATTVGALGVLIVGIGAAEVAMRYIAFKLRQIDDEQHQTSHIGYVNGYHAELTQRRPV